MGSMLLTTASIPGGYRVMEHRGVVFGESVVGVNFVKDALSRLTDVFGGRSGSYENELKKARDTALREMVEAAKKLESNAIIGIDVDYEALGEKSSMLMVIASGTAVVVVPDRGA